MPTPDDIPKLIDVAIGYYLGESADATAAREYLARTARVLAALEAGIPAPRHTGRVWVYTRNLLANAGPHSAVGEALVEWWDATRLEWSTAAEAILAAAEAAGLEE